LPISFATLVLAKRKRNKKTKENARPPRSVGVFRATLSQWEEQSKSLIPRGF
jgi:hypothetical protein